MAITFTNPLRALWGYLRGDDLKAADARSVAAGPALPAERAPAAEETTSASTASIPSTAAVADPAPPARG